MNTVRRGEIYYIVRSGDASCGSEMNTGRPAIVVSNDKNNVNSSVIEVVYLTTQPKNDQPTHVRICSAIKPSIALCEQVSSVSYERVGDYVGACSIMEMQQIDIAIAVSLGLDREDSGFLGLHDTASRDDIIRLEAERDVYKKLYEQLIDRRETA